MPGEGQPPGYTGVLHSDVQQWLGILRGAGGWRLLLHECNTVPCPQVPPCAASSKLLPGTALNPGNSGRPRASPADLPVLQGCTNLLVFRHGMQSHCRAACVLVRHDRQADRPDGGGMDGQTERQRGGWADGQTNSTVKLCATLSTQACRQAHLQACLCMTHHRDNGLHCMEQLLHGVVFWSTILHVQ